MPGTLNAKRCCEPKAGIDQGSGINDVAPIPEGDRTAATRGHEQLAQSAGVAIDYVPFVPFEMKQGKNVPLEVCRRIEIIEGEAGWDGLVDLVRPVGRSVPSTSASGAAEPRASGPSRVGYPAVVMGHCIPATYGVGTPFAFGGVQLLRGAYSSGFRRIFAPSP